MKEKLISKATAKLAKKKGFNIACKARYTILKTKTVFTINAIHNARTTKSNVILVPTQSLLQTWLREKFSIHVEVIWVDTLDNIYVYHISTTGNAIRPDSKIYYSYEKALEMGLQEALNLTW